MALEGRPEGWVRKDIPRAEREYVIVQCWELRPTTEDTPFKYRNRKGVLYPRAPVRYVKITDFDTRDKVAEYVHHYFGYGTWYVMIRANILNKKFRPLFHCNSRIEARCPYFQKGMCKIWRKTPEWICRNNRKHIFNFKHCATIKLHPYDEPFDDKEYLYEWLPEKDKIKNFWWWKDSGARNRAKPTLISLEE